MNDDARMLLRRIANTVIAAVRATQPPDDIPPKSGPEKRTDDMSKTNGLRLRPWTVKRATALRFNADVHRRLPAVQGAMWAISVRDDREIVGVALVGWPAQEWTTEEVDTLAVLRVAVKEGYPNACSMLYGACWRAARAMGAESLVTYTHRDEPGTSLRASGWIEDGLTDGGEWDRRDRPRQRAIDSEQKRRWWAPGSRRSPLSQKTIP